MTDLFVFLRIFFSYIREIVFVQEPLLKPSFCPDVVPLNVSIELVPVLKGFLFFLICDRVPTLRATL